jgi:translation initiation factor IF-1
LENTIENLVGLKKDNKYSMTKVITYKVEDIFQDIEGDPDNVNMTIPPEVAERAGWKPGDILKITVENGQISITKRSKMAKNDGLIELEGTITDVLPNQTFKVLLENEHIVVCYTSGRLRQNRIRLVLGDNVKIEMTPYDMTKGRITYRL